MIGSLLNYNNKCAGETICGDYRISHEKIAFLMIALEVALIVGAVYCFSYVKMHPDYIFPTKYWYIIGSCGGLIVVLDIILGLKSYCDHKKAPDEAYLNQVLRSATIRAENSGAALPDL